MFLLLGNLCVLLAMGANAISSTRKTTKGILWMQNVSQLMYCGCAVLLKGYSAAVQNVVSIIRNLVAIRKINSKVVEWTLVVLGVVLGMAFNNRGWIGLLPVIGNLQYTLVIFRFKNNERAIKLSFLLSVVAFLVFNVAIYNFVGVIGDTVTIITTATVLFKEKKKAANPPQAEEGSQAE